MKSERAGVFDKFVRSCLDAGCPSYDFRCAMGLCLREDVYCNGTAECPDSSDEPPNCRSEFLLFTVARDRVSDGEDCCVLVLLFILLHFA